MAQGVPWSLRVCWVGFYWKMGFPRECSWDLGAVWCRAVFYTLLWTERETTDGE